MDKYFQLSKSLSQFYLSRCRFQEALRNCSNYLLLTTLNFLIDFTSRDFLTFE